MKNIRDIEHTNDERAEEIFHLVSEIGLGEYITESGVGIHIIPHHTSCLFDEISLMVYTSIGFCFKVSESKLSEDEFKYEFDDYFPGFKEVDVDETIELLTNILNNQLAQTWKIY